MATAAGRSGSCRTRSPTLAAPSPATTDDILGGAVEAEIPSCTCLPGRSAGRRCHRVRPLGGAAGVPGHAPPGIGGVTPTRSTTSPTCARLPREAQAGSAPSMLAPSRPRHADALPQLRRPPPNRCCTVALVRTSSITTSGGGADAPGPHPRQSSWSYVTTWWSSGNRAARFWTW